MAGKSSGILEVAIIEAKPFGFRDAAGEAAGIYPDIIRAVSERSGQRVRMTVVPFARAASLVSIGLADATLMIPNAGITNGARPIGSVLTSTLVVAMRPGLTVSGDRPFDGRLLGRIRGGCQELNQSRPFYEVNNQEQGVKMLLARRIEGFCTSAETLEVAAREFDLRRELEKSQRIVLAKRDVLLFVSSNMPPETAASLGLAVKKLKADGSIDRIMKAHGVTWSVP